VSEYKITHGEEEEIEDQIKNCSTEIEEILFT